MIEIKKDVTSVWVLQPKLKIELKDHVRFEKHDTKFFITDLKKDNLLKNTDVIYGAGISDGNRHNHDELPVLLVGGKNKGKHFRVEKEKPMCDLFVSLLHKHNVDIHHFGDSTGELNVV